jgi:predicted amidohydrolase
MERFIAAAIQMSSTSSKSDNLGQAAKLIDEAAARGAQLVCLPETMNYIGADTVLHSETIPGGKTVSLLSGLAARHKIWLHGGSIYEVNNSPADARPYNTKLHMFDVNIKNGPRVRESDLACPGGEIVTCPTDGVGHLGLSVCYDLRFCELYRLMALAGAEILLVPANFLLNTGKDHWEPLLRARAIENACYVVAPAQTGANSLGIPYGRSMIVDPWGNILACAPDRPSVVTAEIDLDTVAQVRAQLPVLQNRRGDVYSLTVC